MNPLVRLHRDCSTETWFHELARAEIACRCARRGVGAPASRFNLSLIFLREVALPASRNGVRVDFVPRFQTARIVLEFNRLREREKVCSCGTTDRMLGLELGCHDGLGCVNGYIGHTDHAWWQFLRARPDLREVDFWRPGGGRRFLALNPGEPFFFRLKAPINQIGGFGLFARYATLPVWRAWEVFGQANGVEDEHALLARLAQLARRRVDIADGIGCIAVAECAFFDPDDWVEVPDSFRPQNVSGSRIDLESDAGRRLMGACLERALAHGGADSWVHEAAARERGGQPYLVHPRLGQGSFRLAVMDAYGGACALTGEHALPALEAAHIRPWSAGGKHELQNGLPLRRDLHRLFDLGYVSARPDGRLLVSPRLRTEFANGDTYYAFAGEHLRTPVDAAAKPARDLLTWHSECVYRSA